MEVQSRYFRYGREDVGHAQGRGSHQSMRTLGEEDVVDAEEGAVPQLLASSSALAAGFSLIVLLLSSQSSSFS